MNEICVYQVILEQMIDHGKCCGSNEIYNVLKADVTTGAATTTATQRWLPTSAVQPVVMADNLEINAELVSILHFICSTTVNQSVPHLVSMRT